MSPQTGLRAVLATLAAALLLAGCGGGGDQHFSADDYPFSFDYPSGWTLTHGADSGGDTAGTAQRSVSVALKEPFDKVVITQFEMKKKLPSGANGYQPEVDRIVARLTRQAGGSAGDAKVVKYGDLPGYQYVLTYPSGATKLESKLTFLFRGQDEFQVNCQSSQDKREELLAGCDQILESLKFE